jgi:hypothetical protein
MVLYKLKGMKKVLKEKQLDYLERFIRVNMIDSVSMEVDSVKVVTENDSLVVYLYLVEDSSLIDMLHLIQNEWVTNKFFLCKWHKYKFLLEKDEKLEKYSIKSIILNSYKKRNILGACRYYVTILNTL